MVLLVPKALAKQIMRINTRRIKKGRRVSEKERGAEGGPDQKHQCGSRERGKEDAGAGEEEKPSFLQKPELEMETSFLLSFHL